MPKLDGDDYLTIFTKSTAKRILTRVFSNIKGFCQYWDSKWSYVVPKSGGDSFFAVPYKRGHEEYKIH